ncbi:RidA family protein [Emticicia sp. BO119]|uniref:RidA family protein n=1 Tax=Emticicia sp. BO119 TaxID=2757768 RepID=UPI0015F0A7DD|nr:RidA family protein [Emticicia sp. BO119]MBA4852838.1 RidA family protein [Emticicia sp. BO119]
MNKLLLTGLLAFSTLLTFGQNKEIVETKKAPIPIAPYSQGVKANGMLYVAGQIGLKPETRKLVEGGVEAETTQIMENIKAIVEAAGAKMEDIVNTTIYMKDIANFAKVNELYGQYFTGKFPARTTIGVANLPGGANIEIAVIAILPKIRRK